MRWLAGLWVIVALAATAGLGAVGTFAGHWPEGAHLVGHIGLCGGFAALVAASAPGTATSRATTALVAAVAFGAAIELVQLRYGPPWSEVVFDLGVDALGAVAGILAWAEARRPARRPEAVGHVVSAVLHPLGIAPLALGAGILAAGGMWPTVAMWLTIAAVCLGPAIALWGVGIWRGWWSDADLSRRRDRGPLFAVGCAGTVAFVLAATWGPDPVPTIALGAVAGAILGTLVTLAGLKVSGHVAIPVALALLVGPHPRLAGLLIGVGLLLSWARVAAGRHQVVEVGAGWGIALAVGNLI